MLAKRNRELLPQPGLEKVLCFRHWPAWFRGPKAPITATTIERNSRQAPPASGTQMPKVAEVARSPLGAGWGWEAGGSWPPYPTLSRWPSALAGSKCGRAKNAHLCPWVASLPSGGGEEGEHFHSPLCLHPMTLFWVFGCPLRKLGGVWVHGGPPPWSYYRGSGEGN